MPNLSDFQLLVTYSAAREVLEQAEERIKAMAEQQIEIMRRVLAARGLREQHRDLFYSHDWIDVDGLAYGDTYRFIDENGEEHAIDMPAFSLWQRGRCGNSDEANGSYVLHGLVFLGKLDEYEAMLMQKYETESQRVARHAEEQRQREIAHLRAQLAKLEGAAS